MARLGKPMLQSVMAHFCQLVISLGLVVIVSRILPPDDVGVYLMAYAVILLLLPLRDFQIQSYVIQADTIDVERMRRVAFAGWSSSLLALSVSLAGAGIFNLTYPDTVISDCLLIMSAGFLIRPFASPALAMLARELRYGALAWIKLAAAVAKAIVTLGLLASGEGPEALAWGILAEIAFELTALPLVARKYRLVRPKRTGSSEVFDYCAPFAGSHLVITLSLSLTPILIGGYQGLAMTAFFNRGRTVMQFFRSSIEGAIQPIVLSEFSRVREDREKLRQSFLRGTAMMTAISWPALAWLIVNADALTVFLFGPEWRATAPLAQILALGGVIYATTALTQQLHAAIEQTKTLLWRDGLLQVPLLLLILVAAPISTTAVAWGFVAYSALGFLVHVVLVRKSLELDPGTLVVATGKSALVAGTTVLTHWLALLMLGEWLAPQTQLLVSTVLAAFAWMFALAAFRHPLSAEARAAIGGRPIDQAT